MALQPTTVKIDLDLADLDRNLYTNQRFTMAQHPSETNLRFSVRLIAKALWFSEALSFGRGLAFPDEPALLEKSLDDRLLHWIDVGLPDLERITSSVRKAEQVSILAYGGLTHWQDKVLPKLARFKNLRIAYLEGDALQVLADGLQRSQQWSVLITEGTVFITVNDQQHQLQPQWLFGEN